MQAKRHGASSSANGFHIPATPAYPPRTPPRRAGRSTHADALDRPDARPADTSPATRPSATQHSDAPLAKPLVRHPALGCPWRAHLAPARRAPAPPAAPASMRIRPCADRLERAGAGPPSAGLVAPGPGGIGPPCRASGGVASPRVDSVHGSVESIRWQGWQGRGA